MGSTILNKTCLRSTYSLRRQLIVSYGCTAFFTISIVVIFAAMSAQRAGETVKDQTASLLQAQIIDGLREWELQTAGLVTQKFQTLRGSAALLTEIIRDRIVGYPDDFADDRNIPFVDMDTRENGYPLKGPRLPRDFEVVSNWSPKTIKEHAQERAESMRDLIGIFSTNSASFSFQGNCDPSESDPSAPVYFENCTAANNDPSLGGVIHPVSTLSGLEQKAYDIGVLLKPLWEAESSAFQLSVYFFNSGAGAVVTFPSFRGDSSTRYESSGCEWMRATNPFTGKPYGGEDAIGRCSLAGTNNHIRLYNPMERKFCHDQVMHPEEIRIFGPYLDVWGQWRLTIGQAVFDRKTGEFLACTGHDLNLQLGKDLTESLALNNRTSTAIVRLDGTVVAGAGFDLSKATETITIADTDFVDKKTYEVLTSKRFWETDTWDPSSATSSYRNNHVRRLGMFVMAIPSPLPPGNFDKDYQPDFWVFIAADVRDVFGLIDKIDGAIEGEVGDLIMNSVLIGLSGLFVFLLVIAFVSHILTRPLIWMEMTAWKIVNHADKRMSDELVVSHSKDEKNDPLVRCTPKTEIRELVSEFQTMIQGFSGTGASRVAPSKMDEVKNFITWKEDFRQFYQLNQSMEDRIKEEMSQKTQSYGRRLSMGKRSKNNGSYGPSASEIIANFSEISQVSEEDTTFRSAELRKDPTLQKQFGRTDSSTLFKRPLTRTNLGSNLPVDGTYGRINHMEESVRISRSSLFRWVLCSIVLPLVLTNIVITALVANNLLDSFPQSVEKADYFSYNLEMNFLRDTGSLHALNGVQVLPGAMRDLHLINRMASWLIFDAIPRSEIFPDLELAMVEECKAYSADEVCPFDADPSRSPCDCEWHDPWGQECDDFSVRTRRLQRMWFLCQARDFDPINGERRSSLSFPEFDFNPVSTKWWSDVTDMPGVENGGNATGYDTTYDRLRVISALQTVAFPLYNYFNVAGFDGSRTSLSTYFAFESDGGYIGYAGCNYDASRYSQFKSSEENGAYLISPELCPVGKYGYDPRCRKWYSETKKKALWQERSIHVTPPYKFAATNDVGTSAASAVIDPTTKEYIGTAAIDFSPTAFFDSLISTSGDFYFVISPDEGLDTIVGPGHPLGSPPKAIEDVVLPYDGESSRNRLDLGNITASMKAGLSGMQSFHRKSADGANAEIILSYAPVHTRVLKPVKPDDYTRGAKASQELLYSVGIAKYASTLEKPFQGIEEEIESSLEATTIIYVSIVAVITFFCIIITAKISIAITKPMLILLCVVQRVNAGRIEDDLPPLEGGSREVTQVYTSFAKLYKIVRMSNSSFFSGDFKWAHHIAQDALKLFRKIGDEKAVAIACNNIGNTLLALSVQSRERGTCLLADGACCVNEAIHHFDEAIALGTKEFEATESDTKKAEFAQQLADRHFNRAMCLLHCLDDPCCPPNAKEKAFTDISRCREYDRGVQEFMLHVKLMFKFSDVVFERLLRRIHGLSLLFNVDRTVWQVWDVNDLVEQADLMLQAAWDQDNAPLFRDVTRVGRLQQLEGAVVGLEFTSGKLEEASQLAMRMLIEDEFVIDSSFVIAADTLLTYMKEPNLTWTRESKLRTSLEFRRMRRAGKRTALDIERCFVFCLELGDQLAESGILAQLNSELLALYEEQCNAKDSVGLVSIGSNVDSNIIVKLSPKEKIDTEQREALDTATRQIDGGASNASLPTAVNMVTSPSRSRTSDVFLIYVSDGSTWDPKAFATMQKKIREVSSKRTASINIIAIGVDIENDSFCDSCQNLCLATRSRHSNYLKCSQDSIGDVFERAAILISSSSSSESSRIQLGITMERF